MPPWRGASLLSGVGTKDGIMPLGARLHAKHSQVFRLGHVLNLLQMSSTELDAHLAAEAHENPMLVLRQRRAAGMNATDALEMTAVAQANSLYDHVFRELAGLIAQGGLMERLITALIAELEPSGWLGSTPEAIAESLGIGVTLVETALRVVQSRVDPQGCSPATCRIACGCSWKTGAR